MAGVSQQPPREVVDPDLSALLKYRYELYLRYPVAADQIAFDIAPEASRKEQRSLSTKILRLFRDGIGRSSARWSYFETQIRLGVPPDKRADELRICAAHYRKAFPDADDCPNLEPETRDSKHFAPHHVAAATLQELLANEHRSYVDTAKDRDQAQAELAETRRERDLHRAALDAVEQRNAALAQELHRARGEVRDTHYDAATAKEDAEKLAARNAMLERQLERARLRPGSDPGDATPAVASMPTLPAASPSRPAPAPATATATATATARSSGAPATLPPTP